MSYCRWSSDDFQCDVYVYEDASGGWTTHVAANRRTPDEPFPLAVPCDPFDDEKFAAWHRREEIVLEMVNRAPSVPIGLPADGQTFNDPTPGACADRLESLLNLGYVVPQRVIDDLHEEHASVGGEDGK